MSMHKRILVFCDGTGADANAIEIPTGPGVGVAIAKNATNVIRLSRSVKAYSADGKWQQLVFYQSGVGSVTDFNANTVAGTTITQATGLAVATKIREAYAYIAQNFQDGDEIFLFGFSRGAYTARKIAGLIDAIGLLNTEELGSFYKYWAKLMKGEKFTKPGRDVKIKCVGVWDTVGSILRLTDALHISDSELPKSVITALQALSLQDNRKTGFRPTQWVPPASGLLPGQTLSEVWFPGAHADVGGGYKIHELSDLALFWMADKLTYPTILVDLDLGFITRSRSTPQSTWGFAQPHNAWNDSHIGVPGSRLDLCKKEDLYHLSIKFAPTKLDQPSHMITLDDLKKKFSTSSSPWTPNYPTLGAYEQDRKDHWKDPRNDTEITFEDERDLFMDAVVWVKTDLDVPITDMIQVGNYDNVMRCVARVSVGKGCYPGMAAPSVPKAWYGKADGSEYSATADYEVLIGREDSVQWVPITGNLDTTAIPGGATPVEGGHDANGVPFYIARYQGYGGKVQASRHASYTKGDGQEYQTTSYDVLVYNSLGTWVPSAGSYTTASSTAAQSNSTSISINRMARPPVVAIGLNKLEMATSRSTERIRVMAFADHISSTSLTAHIDTWSDSTLYNGSLSWMTLASNDPKYQCGSWSQQCDSSSYTTDPTTQLSRTITQRVNFPTSFNSQPKVFVGISGLNLGGDWYLSVTASDIDAYGFTMNVSTAKNTKLYGIKVDWVAYLPNEANFWNGNVSYNSDKATTVGFGIHFLNTPVIFTAITQFDIDNAYRLRMKVDTSNISNSGMDIGISKWSDSVINSATVGYLAIDPVVAA